MDKWVRLVLVFADDTGRQSLVNFYEDEDVAKAALETATQSIPEKYGKFMVRRAVVLVDEVKNG